MKKNGATNLPTQTTTLIGRDREIDELYGLLQSPDCRLLTLVGPGGIGKTRLAIAVAAEQELPVIYVPLQAIASADLLPSAIADAAGFALAGADPLSEQLLDQLHGKRLLFVLDNFEHLLAGTDLLDRILQEAPDVKLLLTSREALNMSEEWLYPVPGLSIPVQGEDGNPSAYGAVQLFDERARQIRHDFRLADEVAHVIAICRTVEGMPLAIELAASWLTVLNCAAVADRLRHSHDILSTSHRNVPERHRSMDAVFDQSWSMLNPDHRNTFMRLTVFRGGFTFEAAAEVASATLPIMAALVAKTLVRRDAGGRYQVHELLRQYAANKLADSQDAEAAAQRSHGAFFLHFLADRNAALRGPRQRQVAKEVGSELENIRQAWQWASDHLETESIRSAAPALVTYCQLQSRYQEGADLFLEAARRLETDKMTFERGTTLVATLINYGWLCIRLGRLDDADSALARAQSLCYALQIPPTSTSIEHPLTPSMFVALVRGDYKKATKLGETVLSLVEESAQPDYVMILHYGLASAALAQEDYMRAKRHAGQGISLLASDGNQRNVTFLRGVLGQVAMAEDDPQTAQGHFEAAYRICEELADPGCMAEHLANLASVALLQQRWPETVGLYRRSHQIYEEIGDRGGIARTRLGIGMVAQKREERDAARRHYHLALAIAAKAQITPVILSVLAAVGDFILVDNDDQPLGQRALTFVLHHPSCDAQIRSRVLDSLARSHLSDIELEPNSDTLEELVAALQSELAAPTEDLVQTQPLIEPLTAREREVLRLLADGRSNSEIAKELVVAVGTVKAHASRIYRKLDVTSRTQAVVRARELGLLA